MLFLISLILIIVIIIVTLRAEEHRNQEWAKKILGDLYYDDFITVEKGQLRGGDYPLLGTTTKYVRLLLTREHLIIESDAPVVISLRQVRGQMTTVSNVSALGIFAFGLAGLGAKVKVMLLEIDDLDSREKYSGVFSGIPDSFVDTLNRQRYYLLTKRTN